MIVKMRQDSELVDLTKNVSRRLISYFKKNYEFYNQGNWAKAKKGFTKIIKRKKDGPSLFLLETMKEYKFMPPQDWKGIRKID